MVFLFTRENNIKCKLYRDDNKCYLYSFPKKKNHPQISDNLYIIH